MTDMTRPSNPHREPYAALMSALAPVVARAVNAAPNSTPVNPDEVDAITAAGNSLLRELDAERKPPTPPLRIVTDDQD